MKKLPFLLEIGSEEIPDWMIPAALEQLRGDFTRLLAAARLDGEVEWADATPRRLVLRAKGIVERQPDTEELVSGPPKSAGEGAAQGFARKQGVSIDQLGTISTPKGEYFAFRKQLAGRAASDILAEALPGLILGLYFPKTMYWTGKGGPRFIRPIRWLVALLGSGIVPFEIAGVRSGNVSRGHRQLGKGAIKVAPGSYVEKLRRHFVIVHAEERRARITAEIDAFATSLNLRVKSDPALLETLTFITEYPTAILGSFDPQYLSLPAEVLVTVMRHHQKYFSVEQPDGSLAPNFVAVMNTSADPDGLVRHGNERVLRARFNDARFFWEMDQHKKLADRVPDLASVTFQKDLGSYLEKTNRVVALARQLGGESAARAAQLCKTDLTTEMVKEFTELQGIVGGLYARAQGETEDVARAIYEHYKPESMEDSIPSTPAGRILALADKLDTLRGCFGIGLVPSGSKDPFALRRAAHGILKILVEGRLDLSVETLLGGDAQLRDFFLDRLRYYFRDIRGYKYDEVNAVLAAGWDNLPDAASRMEAIRMVRPTGNFEPLAASFKRIGNILRQAGYTQAGTVDPALLEAGPEFDLHAEFERLRGVVDLDRSNREYLSALRTIASLRPKVDLFFDKVLVNAPDEKVRSNRLALLANLLREFSSIADFSEIVTNS
jgi:glycyl-tRNA synthetase beta chain